MRTTGTRWNILRCLGADEALSRIELDMCHAEVRNGLRGLPDLFGRLAELEDLLARR